MTFHSNEGWRVVEGGGVDLCQTTEIRARVVCAGKMDVHNATVRKQVKTSVVEVFMRFECIQLVAQGDTNMQNATAKLKLEHKQVWCILGKLLWVSLKKGNERSERLEAPGGTREKKNANTDACTAKLWREIHSEARTDCRAAVSVRY